MNVTTAGSILTHLCSGAKLAALVITEANPRRDPDGKYLPQLRQLIADALNATARLPDSTLS